MNNMRLILILGTSALYPVFSAQAQTAGQCAIAPTCAELGYEQKAADCGGQYMLKCPFDKSQVFCGGTACAADYSLDSCDTSIGTCDKCGEKYKYTACNSGWTLSNGKCTANDCSAYTLSSCPSNGSCSSCKSGSSSTKYKLSSCSSGWTVSGNSCVAASCSSSYNRSSCPSYAYCYSCKSGNTTKYEFAYCTKGSWTGYSCAVDSNCSDCYSYWVTESCDGVSSYSYCTGSDTRSTYYCATSCRSDYRLNGGQCECTSSSGCGGLC